MQQPNIPVMMRKFMIHQVRLLIQQFSSFLWFKNLPLLTHFLFILVHWPTPSQLVKNPELQQMVEQFLGATAQDINLYYLIITTAKSMKEEEQNT